MILHIEERSIEAAMGSRLRARRLAIGLSLADLTRRTAIPDSTLWRVENGKERLAPKAVIALARAFDVTPSWFFESLD